MDFGQAIISKSAHTLKIITGVKVEKFARLADRFWLILSVTTNFHFIFSSYLSYTEFDYLEWKIADNYEFCKTIRGSY